MNRDQHTGSASVLQGERNNSARKFQLQRERRVGIRALLVLFALVGAAMVATGNRTATAQGGKSLADRVAALERAVQTLQATDTDQGSQIAALQTTLKAQSSQITSLQNTVDADGQRIAALQNTVTSLSSQVTGLQASTDQLLQKTQFLSIQTDPITGSLDMYVTGTNLHILNGLGATNGNPAHPYGTYSSYVEVNGKGNLIIGYNESRVPDGSGPDVRTGSHNLIIGTSQNYSSFGGINVGLFNNIGGAYSSVTCGIGNQATGFASSVTGGDHNIASGDFSAISAGAVNTASGDHSSICGGGGGTAAGTYASVAGGSYNMASGSASFVGGGESNNAGGLASSVTGGRNNNAGGLNSSVSGGYFNYATHGWSSVSGGNQVVQQTDYGWSGGSYHSP